MFRHFIKVAFLIFLFSACAPSVAPVSSTEAEPLPTSTPRARANIQREMLISPDTAQQVKLIRTLAGNNDRVMALAFSADDITIASYSRDKTIKLWDVTTGRETYTFNNVNQDINSIAFSPDGRLLASAETIWDVKSKQVLHGLDRGKAVNHPSRLTENCSRWAVLGALLNCGM